MGLVGMAGSNACRKASFPRCPAQAGFQANGVQVLVHIQGLLVGCNLTTKVIISAVHQVPAQALVLRTLAPLKPALASLCLVEALHRQECLVPHHLGSARSLARPGPLSMRSLITPPRRRLPSDPCCRSRMTRPVPVRSHHHVVNHMGDFDNPVAL